MSETDISLSPWSNYNTYYSYLKKTTTTSTTTTTSEATTKISTKTKAKTTQNYLPSECSISGSYDEYSCKCCENHHNCIWKSKEFEDGCSSILNEMNYININSSNYNSKCSALCECDREVTQCWAKLAVPVKEDQCFSKIIDAVKLASPSVSRLIDIMKTTRGKILMVREPIDEMLTDFIENGKPIDKKIAEFNAHKAASVINESFALLDNFSVLMNNTIED
uniref:PA2c domain-containing protein n=1 Tax=Meloidogyne hapla TaxID=6305 RepID=A0A1I8BXA8_MELHA